MTTPRDAIGLSDRLRSTTEMMACRCSVPMDLWQDHSSAALEAATALDALQARVKELEAERQEVREILAGSDYGSLPNDWTLAQVADARMDNISKLRWQVNDTCSRAEAAEARATSAEQERDEAYERAVKLIDFHVTDDDDRYNLRCAIRRLAAGTEKEGK